jgi:hypothetical protein
MIQWEYFVGAVIFGSVVLALIGINYQDKAEQNLKEGVTWHRGSLIEPDKFTDVGLFYRRKAIRFHAIAIVFFLSAAAILAIFGREIF